MSAIDTGELEAVNLDEPSSREAISDQRPATADESGEASAAASGAAVAAHSDPSAQDRLRAKLCPPMPTDKWLALCVATFLTGIAAVLRLINLGQPNAFVFDEEYYPVQAWSLLQRGVDYEPIEDFKEQILAGNSAVLTDQIAFVVHPPLGKWLMALGEAAFGLTPFGWRVSSAVAGTLCVLLTFYVARRLTRSTLLGGLAGLLVAVDGLSIVMSRLGLLDIFLTMFLVAAFGCLLIDRDRTRLRYAEAAIAGQRLKTRLWRPWRIAGGLCLGLACGVKWSGIYVLAVLGIATVLWEIGGYRILGEGKRWARGLLIDGPFAFVSIVGTAGAAYVATWAGWFVNARDWSGRWYGGAGPIDSFIYYHGYIYRLLSDIDTPHSWQSHPISWLIQWRPVLAYRSSVEGSDPSCASSSCYRDILAVGTPLFWWVGCLALVACIVLAVRRMDWRAGTLLALVGSVWLPWFAFPDRTVFSFYIVAAAPFLAMSLALMAGYVIGDSDASIRRRTLGAVVVGAFAIAVIAQTMFLWPMLAGDQLTLEQWQDRILLPSWN